MANIPGADPTPDVAPRPMPQPYDDNRAPAEAFGAGVGPQLEQQSRAVDQVANEYQQRANAVAIEGAFGRAQKALNDIILDPNQGYLSLKGQDALDKGDEYTGKYQQALEQIRGSLKNDAQKREIGFRLDRLRETGVRLAASHERGQHDVIAEAASKGSEQQTTQTLISAASNPSMDPKTLNSTLLGGVSDLMENARQDATYRYGQNASPEAVKALAMPKIQQAAALAVESAIATENPDHAQRVFQQLRPFLGTRSGMLAENQIQRRVDQRDGLGWAQAAASQSRVPGTTLIGDGADDLLETLRANERPEMLKVAEQELQRLKVAGRQMQKERSQSAFTSGIAAINKNDWITYQKAIDTLSVPEGEGGELLKTLIDFRASQAGKDAKSPAVVRKQAESLNDANHLLAASRASDYDSANAFLTQKANPADQNSPTIAETLSPMGILEFGKAFERKQQAEAADKALSGEAEKQILDNIREALSYPDIKVSEPTADQKAERAAIQQHVRDQRNAWQASNPGKQPGQAEYQGWIDEELAKVPGTAESGFWHFLRSDRRRVDVDIAGQQPQAGAAPPAQQAPTAPAPQPQAAVAPLAPPTVKTKADYDALAPGTRYVGPDGKIATKKGP